MDNNVVKGKWLQLKGEAKKQWGKLTDDDLDVIDGEKDKLVGKLQERYGHTKDAAEAEYNSWEKSFRSQQEIWPRDRVIPYSYYAIPDLEKWTQAEYDLEEPIIEQEEC